MKTNPAGEAVQEHTHTCVNHNIRTQTLIQISTCAWDF